MNFPHLEVLFVAPSAMIYKFPADLNQLLKDQLQEAVKAEVMTKINNDDFSELINKLYK
jgi:polyphosphate kinase